MRRGCMIKRHKRRESLAQRLAARPREVNLGGRQGNRMKRGAALDPLGAAPPDPHHEMDCKGYAFARVAQWEDGG